MALFPKSFGVRAVELQQIGSRRRSQTVGDPLHGRRSCADSREIVVAYEGS